MADANPAPLINVAVDFLTKQAASSSGERHWSA
ncbi:hypothetical protein PAECIP111893_03387 [Paenibacillus plantiphilus]|uniref:Uncharacterized protein n=1 Tax=Paenibacillus plantiphilus TaxID=2905650 RepID=A0ABN8GMW7_9BACL|nr:hypothetical protein PAECIP111893_03387 [Paenibacillus plantiphilus]